jgi:hypothetical protein
MSVGRQTCLPVGLLAARSAVAFRRTVFAIIAQLDNAKLQSTISILLVGCIIGLHLHLKPYKVENLPD